MKVTRTTMTQYAIDQIRYISDKRKRSMIETLNEDGYLQGRLDAACELLGDVTSYDAKDGEAEGE